MSTPVQNKLTKTAANFETDASRIVHRHLENKDDVITEDDIRNIRVGAVTEPTSMGTLSANQATDDNA